MLEAIGISECGPARTSNQDSIFLDCRADLFIVADGMGGLERGKEASASATEFFTKCYLENPQAKTSIMLECLQAANRQLFDESRLRGSKAGTTFTAVDLRNSVCNFVHVGDSRLYHFNSTKNQLSQKTDDHSLGAELEKSGTSARATQQFRHILTRSMGTANKVDEVEGVFPTTRGDKLLLCSDGFWQIFLEDELVDYLRKEIALVALADELKMQAIRRHPQDNFSFIIVKT
jgi:serine/threonine protein phosphatase PrpC